MDLQLIIQRHPNLLPWAEGEKIPWNDPDFSRRMLREHLSQEHDAASRRAAKIRQQVGWIQRRWLPSTNARILDLGCGPGLYAAHLAERGHSVVGIDFSPASIAYALEQGLAGCQFILGDLRQVGFGAGYDLAMFIFGEFNVFRPLEARQILEKAHAALKPGGKILLEVSTFDAVEQLGNQPSTWYSAESGLFSERPHLCLMETFWDEDQAVATERFFIVDAETSAVTRYAASTCAYEEDQLTDLLESVGFQQVNVFPSLTGAADPNQPDEFMVLVGQKM